MSTSTVAVVGAGPYGISIAAHLRGAGVDYRIFGSPMHRWRRRMPRGMFLKSEGHASSLSDPAGAHTLERYCAETGAAYRESAWPVPLDVFTNYAMAFQQRMAPDVEDVFVDRIDPDGEGSFHLHLANGEFLRARKVVIATGLEHTAHIPAPLANLPPALLSHSSAHHDLGAFRGREVVVIGAGQSALETATLAAEEGADVRLLARAPSLAWNPNPRNGHTPLYRRLRSPNSGLGAGLQLWTYANAPGMFRFLPASIRFERARNVLGPAGAWWLKERLRGQVSVMLNHSVTSAEVHGNRAVLEVRGPGDQMLRLSADHIIAATGYRFDLSRLPFLSPLLRSRVRSANRAPVLSAAFESTAPGLYFTGLASAPTFGPAMRFLYGADFTARRIARHVTAGSPRETVESSMEVASAVQS